MEINNWDLEKLQDFLSEKIAEVTETDPDDIVITRAFSDYAIDSASGVSLSGDLEEEFNLKLSPTLLFEYPTIEKLAKYLFEEINK